MNNTKQESLYQSMEKWIAAYQAKHNVSEDAAHDAFEEWEQKTRANAQEMTTVVFQKAVVASYLEMSPGVRVEISETAKAEIAAGRTPNPIVIREVAVNAPTPALIPTPPTAEHTREALLKIIRVNEHYLEMDKKSPLPEAFLKDAQEQIELSKQRLKILDEIDERQRSRKGRLTLKKS